MGWIMQKLREKKSKYYWIDWIFTLLLAGAFIYLSLQVREYILTCSCPVYNFTGFNFTAGI